MKNDNILMLENRANSQDPLTELLRSGAIQLLMQAVEIKFQEYLTGYACLKTPEGTAGMVHDGYLTERVLQTGFSPVAVKVPKVRARTTKPAAFHSALVHNLYVRLSKTLDAAICRTPNSHRTIPRIST